MTREPSKQNDPDAVEAWEDLIREEAQEIADRENSCSGCCGPYGTDTWLDYEKGVRGHFEKIGKAYITLMAALKGSDQ